MSTLPPDYTAHAAPLASLDAATFHEIARLRQDIFVVEQECAYPDLDGRDAEPGTVHLWAVHAPSGKLAATLRILVEPWDASASSVPDAAGPGAARVLRIGRVATAVQHRGAGLMGALMRSAIELCGTAQIELEAQSHLQGWYERFGFVRVGDEFLEDGIPHVPMRREATGS